MVRQLRVTLPNRPGTLANMVTALAEAGIDMKALELSDRGPGDHGIASLIVSQVEQAAEALRATGHEVAIEEALAVEMDDRVGGLAPVLATLAAEGISVKQLYAFVTRVEGKSLAVLTVDDPAKGRSALERKGFLLLSPRSLEGPASGAEVPGLGDFLGLIW
jgi:hypothetical protein